MKTIAKKLIPLRLRNLLRPKYHEYKKSRAQHLIGDYSQSGETIEIRNLLQKKRGEKGFFVELGANDGITISSTFGLVKDGWSGIAVEPNPVVYERLRKNLKKFSNVKPMCLAAAPTRGMVKLFLAKNDLEGFLSSICTDDIEWFRTHRSEDFYEVQGIPLTDLLEEQKVEKTFDLLLIDTEGMDYDILLTLNFEKFRPKLIVTEDYQPTNEVKFLLLNQADYTFKGRVGYNTFWLSCKNNDLLDQDGERS